MGSYMIELIYLKTLSQNKGFYQNKYEDVSLLFFCDHASQWWKKVAGQVLAPPPALKFVLIEIKMSLQCVQFAFNLNSQFCKAKVEQFRYVKKATLEIAFSTLKVAIAKIENTRK